MRLRSACCRGARSTTGGQQNANGVLGTKVHQGPRVRVDAQDTVPDGEVGGAISNNVEATRKCPYPEDADAPSHLEELVVNISDFGATDGSCDYAYPRAAHARLEAA